MLGKTRAAAVAALYKRQNKKGGREGRLFKLK